MFRRAALVFKDGALVVRDGQVSHYTHGKALHIRPRYDWQIHEASQTLLRRPLRPAARRLRRARRGAAAHGRLCGGSMPDIIRNGVTIDDNLAEAFPMSGTGILITAPAERQMGAAGGADDDRFCNVGHGLRLRRPNRSRSAAGGNAGRTSRAFARCSSPCRRKTRRSPARQPARPMRADLPGSAVYSTVAGESGDHRGSRRRGAPVRRQVADVQGRR